MALLDYLSRSSDKPVSGQSVRWKIIHLDGPMIKQIGLGAEYGVVISSDAMLEKTQTLLFCPLIDGLDEDDMPLAKLPWHVEVKIDDRPNQAKVRFKRMLVSTKIVLPISLNEIDGRERGRLAAESRSEVMRMLRKWLPTS